MVTCTLFVSKINKKGNRVKLGQYNNILYPIQVREGYVYFCRADKSFEAYYPINLCYDVSNIKKESE